MPDINLQFYWPPCDYLYLLVSSSGIIITMPFPSSSQPPFQSEAKCEFCYENQFSFILKLELIIITKISHLDSLWKRDWGELGNGLFYCVFFTWLHKNSVYFSVRALVTMQLPKSSKFWNLFLSPPAKKTFAQFWLFCDHFILITFDNVEVRLQIGALLIEVKI